MHKEPSVSRHSSSIFRSQSQCGRGFSSCIRDYTSTARSVSFDIVRPLSCNGAGIKYPLSSILNADALTDQVLQEVYAILQLHLWNFITPKPSFWLEHGDFNVKLNVECLSKALKLSIMKWLTFLNMQPLHGLKGCTSILLRGWRHLSRFA